MTDASTAGGRSHRGFLLIAAATVMMAGYGLAFSFTAVYIAALPGAGVHAVAFYFASLGVAGVLTGMVMSTDVGKVSPRPTCVMSVLVAMCALLLLPRVDSVPGVVVTAAALGASAALFQATIVSLLQAITPADHLRLAFAIRYQSANLALAVGVSVAGVLVDRHGVPVMRVLFVVAALAHIPLLTLLLSRPFWPSSTANSDGSHANPDPHSGRVSVASILRRVAPLMLFQAAAGILVFPHLESTLPLIVNQIEGGPAIWLTAAVLANLIGVLVLQVPMVRLLKNRPVVDGLRLAAALWVAAHAFVLALASTDLLSPVVGLVAYGALIAAGECAYSASFMPCLIEAAPRKAVTQTSSMANTTSNIGTLIGPSLGAFLIGFGSQVVVWAVLLLACLTVLLPSALALSRLPGPVSDRKGAERPPMADEPNTRTPARKS